MKLEWDYKELEDFCRNLESAEQTAVTMKKIARDIAKALLKRMKSLTPIDTYELINGWDGNKFLVTTAEDGYEVLIVNKTPYATAVNDGHMAYNQFGGPYPIKRRIQVRSPHRWQQGNQTYYVFGHFFVERGMVQLNGTKEIESIILRELEKWWRKI